MLPNVNGLVWDAKTPVGVLLAIGVLLVVMCFGVLLASVPTFLKVVAYCVPVVFLMLLALLVVKVTTAKDRATQDRMGFVGTFGNPLAPGGDVSPGEEKPRKVRI